MPDGVQAATPLVPAQSLPLKLGAQRCRETSSKRRRGRRSQEHGLINRIRPRLEEGCAARRREHRQYLVFVHPALPAYPGHRPKSTNSSASLFNCGGDRQAGRLSLEAHPADRQRPPCVSKIRKSHVAQIPQLISSIMLPAERRICTSEASLPPFHRDTYLPKPSVPSHIPSGSLGWRNTQESSLTLGPRSLV